MLKIGNYIKIIKYDYFLRTMLKMSKHNYKKSRLKYVFLAFTCAATFAFSGIAAACGDNSSENETDKTTSKEDTQLLKNGNFEFFTVPEKKEGGNEPEYLIKAVENWSHGGTGSYTMSGIISTSDTAWGKISDSELADKLDYNNELDSSASNYLSEYVDYNGMKSSDILYKDQYEALRSEDDYKEGEEIPENRKDVIENPKTHYNVTGNAQDGYKTVDGQTVYVDENGEYFLEDKNDKGEYGKPISNVLMLHNYQTSHNGIAQNYTSINLELPANTAAEISVWVKTAYLKFSQGKDVTQDRGANITVTQSVGGSSLDKFVISCINTEKLIEEKKVDDKYNGWVQYTVYVNACDFAATTIGINLGLGESGYTTEGYAFFDDVTVTKYVSLDNSESYKANKDKLTNTTCNLSSDVNDKIYKADSYVRNEGLSNEKKEERNSNDFYYFIDLASETNNGGNTYTPVNFGNSVYNVKAGLTIDDNNYVSSKNVNYTSNMTSFDYAGCRLPFTSDLKNSGGLKTDGDYLAFVKAGYQFKESDTAYYEKLNSALGGAANLPKNDKDNANNMLVMLSTYGAAYTTSFDLSVPRNGSDSDGYMIVSFWVKTSDMSGNTAATVTITQTGNDENTASFTVDTTNAVTDIGDSDDEKDIYDGWVQCFFFVQNELEADDETADSFTVEFSFGNTVISGTDVNSYKPGWVALANMQYLSVDEDTFSYMGSGDHTASLTISEEAEKNTQVFDNAYANQSHEIKDDMVNPSSYKGVNGGSSAVKNNGHVSIPFDEFNNNEYEGEKFTGLINKEHFGNYKDNNLSWYETLCKSFNVSTTDAVKAWNEIFGEKSYQPLVITNKTRTSYLEERGATKDTYKNYYVKNDDGEFEQVAADADFDETETYYSLKKVMNYGYIGENKNVSADSYATISVRIKVSANAIAYVYLVDTSAGKNLLSFSAPSYSFNYDEEGNVLKEKPKANATASQKRELIVYTLRDDGLYEDKDGNLYANTLNYAKLYYIEDMTYYDKDGKTYSIEDLVDGVTYYDEDGIEADHYLVTSDGVKIYQYIDGSYHYIVKGKTQSEIVLAFDKQYAIKDYLYDGMSEDYMVKIEGPTDDWVTVNFVIHAGSAAKSYRLELWSGERTEYTTEGNKEDGTVIFDYSYTSVSSDDAKNEYEQEIIDAYLKELAKVGALKDIDTTGKNINYFKAIAESDEYKDKVKINPYDYKAHYYTYSLYDSADFQPFNKEIASDGATGYDYSAADQSETLAYLQVRDGNVYSVFVDYSAIDKSISLNNPTDSDDGDDNDSNKSSDGSIWLLASSIILVVALLFAIVAIFLRDALKKARRNKVTSKNNYDQRKANRYKKKLHLTQEETVEVDANVEDTEKADEVPLKEVEEAPATEVEETTEETTPDDPSDESKE